MACFLRDDALADKRIQKYPSEPVGNNLRVLRLLERRTREMTEMTYGTAFCLFVERVCL